MGLFIKNPNTERKARELASIDGKSLTAAIEDALDAALAQRRAARPRPTLESLMAATAAMHAACGYVPGSSPPVTKEEWDELNETGFPEIDDA